MARWKTQKASGHSRDKRHLSWFTSLLHSIEVEASRPPPVKTTRATEPVDKDDRYPHHSVQHGSVRGAPMVRRAGQALGQVARAVQRVCVRPLLERFLPVEEHQLKRHRGFLERGEIKRKSRLVPCEAEKCFLKKIWHHKNDCIPKWKRFFMLHSRNSCVM